MSTENYTGPEEDKNESLSEGANTYSGGENPENNEYISSLLDKIGLNGEIENRKELEIGINNVFLKNPLSNLKKRFENFCEYSTDEDKKSALEELKQCKTEQEFTDFVKKHQIYKSATFENNTSLVQKQETTATKTETTATETETTATETETTATEVGNQAEISVNIEKIGIKLNDAIELREKLFQTHPDQKKAKEIKDETEREAKAYKEKLPEETKNQLKEKGYDDQIIDNYILVKVTLNKVKEDPSFDADVVKIFDNKVNELSTMDIFLKNIDNACNIADTRLNDFSSENIVKTSRDLFNKDVGNQRLISERDKNKGLHEGAYKKLFSEDISDEISKEKYQMKLINKYGGLLLQDSEVPQDFQDSKLFFTQYQTNPNVRNDINNMKNAPQADEIYKDNSLYISYKNMISALEREKGKVEDKTKDMIEEMCLITQVNGMAKCIGQKNLTFNKAKEIKIENGSMVLDGHIDGVDFSVRHNSTQEWSPLQVSSRLIKSEDGKSFEIGDKEKPKFKSSPYALPGQGIIFNTITDIVSTSINSTERIETTDTYIENMQKNITGKMDEIYADTNEAHDYMQDKVKGEKVISNGIELIENADTNIDFSKPMDNNSILYPFMKILNFNIERSTSPEKDKLNDCVTKILEITKDYGGKGGKDEFGAHKYPPLIDNYLKTPAWLNKTDTNARLGCISDLFKYYSGSEELSDVSRFSPQGSDLFPTRIIINDLHRDLFEAERDNPTTRSPVAKGFKDEGFIADIDNGVNENDRGNDGVTYGIIQKINNEESVA